MTELCFVAALVEDSPFSTIGVIVALRDLCSSQSALSYPHSVKSAAHLEAACAPPNLRKAHKALTPSCCAATFESSTAPRHNPESSIKGLKAGCDSSGVSANVLAASS